MDETLAAAFHRMHDGPGVLVLPNAWDVVSARLYEELGFTAVATTSGGVAATLGYPDGEIITPDEMLGAVARMAGAVRVPVTADMEAGYGLAPDELARRIADAGAVGFNFQDGALDADAHADRVARLKAAEPALFLNARVDVYVRQWGREEERFDEAVRRGKRYLEAGADCVYVIGALDEPTIAGLAAEIPGPLNVMAAPGTPLVPRLAELGVRRLSTATALYRSALAHVRTAAYQLLEHGTYEGFTSHSLSGVEFRRLLERPS